jgi:hypothetical protein
MDANKLMLRFLCTAFVLMTLVLIFTTTAVVWGRVQPEQELPIGFKLCNWGLCYRDIVLMETTEKQARTIIEQSPNVTWSQIHTNRADFSTGPLRWIFVFSTSGGYVRELDLRPHDKVLPLGRIVAELGPPCAIYPFKPVKYQYLVTVSYPTMTFWIETKNWRLEPTSSISEVDLIPPLLNSVVTFDKLVRPCDSTTINYRWKGFVSYPYP